MRGGRDQRVHRSLPARVKRAAASNSTPAKGPAVFAWRDVEGLDEGVAHRAGGGITATPRNIPQWQRRRFYQALRPVDACPRNVLLWAQSQIGLELSPEAAFAHAGALCEPGRVEFIVQILDQPVEQRFEARRPHPVLVGRILVERLATGECTGDEQGIDVVEGIVQRAIGTYRESGHRGHVAALPRDHRHPVRFLAGFAVVNHLLRGEIESLERPGDIEQLHARVGERCNEARLRSDGVVAVSCRGVLADSAAGL